MQRILIATLMAFFFGLFSMPVSQSAPANGLGRWLGGQGDLAAKYDLLSATPLSSLTVATVAIAIDWTSHLSGHGPNNVFPRLLAIGRQTTREKRPCVKRS